MVHEDYPVELKIKVLDYRREEIEKIIKKLYPITNFGYEVGSRSILYVRGMSYDMSEFLLILQSEKIEKKS